MLGLSSFDTSSDALTLALGFFVSLAIVVGVIYWSRRPRAGSVTDQAAGAARSPDTSSPGNVSSEVDSRQAGVASTSRQEENRLDG